MENWIKLSCPPHHLQTESELILRDVNTGTLVPPSLCSPLVAWACKSQVWFGLIWDGEKTHTGGRVNGEDLLLRSGEMRRGLKSCSSLTLLKLIFTLFIKINEMICAVVFSHQSRYKLLLLIVKYCGNVMQTLFGKWASVVFSGGHTQRTTYLLLLTASFSQNLLVLLFTLFLCI